MSQEKEGGNFSGYVTSIYSVLVPIQKLFEDWQQFASTPLGLLFTVGVPILGVAAFIVLSQFHMDFIGGMVLSGAVFGDIALGLMASKLHKHGFFKSCAVGSDGLVSTSVYCGSVVYTPVK